MGVCCSKEKMFPGFVDEDDEDYDDDDWEEEGTHEGDYGARVRLQGSCKFASMYTQQGKKGINQDAMTIWKDFTGEPDMVLCGIFDGHGPLGHKVASHIRDILPSKISLGLKPSNVNDDVVSEEDDDHDISSHDDRSEHNHDENGTDHSPISSWNASFIKAFEDMDHELGNDSTIDTYCSGSTAVVLLKQDEHLMVANLGDSRAVLCCKDNKNQLVPVQLTVDLKPNLPSEAERIKSCNGRVFAMEEEPDVYRLWLPEDDSPGLAMARAFGDFCLKDYGLSSTPLVSYRKISSMDEFVVLATDGVWDVLTNKEVVKIVASARKRSMAAKLLVRRAVRAWKTKYPSSKVDDCAVICLFLKPLSSVSRSVSAQEGSMSKYKKSSSYKSVASTASHETHDTRMTDEEWNALEGVSRVNSVVKLPRFSTSDIPEGVSRANSVVKLPRFSTGDIPKISESDEEDHDDDDSFVST